MKNQKFIMLLIATLMLLAPSVRADDPPLPLEPYVVTATTTTETWSWTTVDLVASGPTSDLYIVSVYTVVFYLDTGDIVGFDFFSYPVLVGHGDTNSEAN